MSDTIVTTRVPTANARRYMLQLCKHWGHKFTVTYDDHHGEIALPAGACKLDAGEDALSVRLEAKEADSVPRFKEVVEEHIKRFAFREELVFDWQGA